MRLLSVALLSISLFGCAVALGPGFNQTYRSVDVSATSIEPTHVRVQVSDKIENIGDRSLAYLDVALPSGPSFGTSDFRVKGGGKDVADLRITRESSPSLRIPFSPPWPQGEGREIAIAYDLNPTP